jgi:hypothetical protein
MIVSACGEGVAGAVERIVSGMKAAGGKSGGDFTWMRWLIADD